MQDTTLKIHLIDAIRNTDDAALLQEIDRLLQNGLPANGQQKAVPLPIAAKEKKPSQPNTLRTITWLGLFLYMAVLSKAILFKQSPAYIKQHLLHYQLKAVERNARLGNYTPMATVSLYYKSKRTDLFIQNVLGNIAGFIPLGLLLPLLSGRLRTFWRTGALVFFTSLLFESIQLVAVLGRFDVDDLLLNTLGGLMGYAVFRFFTQSTRLYPAQLRFS